MNPIEKPDARRGWMGTSESAARTLRVFLADDDLEMRWMLSVVLGRDGHEVVQASDGRELVELLEAVARGALPAPDLVVTDLRMPGPDGLEAVRRLRASGLSIPVLLMTAFPDQHVQREAIRLGAAGVLDKPFEIADFRTLALVLGRPGRTA